MSRDSNEQLKEELDEMYREMTDPEKIREREFKKKVAAQLKEVEQDYGL